MLFSQSKKTYPGQMWNSKNLRLDRDYGSILRLGDHDRQHVHDEENLTPLTIFPGLDDPDEVKPKHFLLFIFSTLCFILTGMFVLALMTANDLNEQGES